MFTQGSSPFQLDVTQQAFIFILQSLTLIRLQQPGSGDMYQLAISIPAHCSQLSTPVATMLAEIHNFWWIRQPAAAGPGNTKQQKQGQGLAPSAAKTATAAP
jgi:hypothetical protein